MKTTLFLLGTGSGTNYDQQELTRMIWDYLKPESTIANTDDFEFLAHTITRGDLPKERPTLIVACPRTTKKGPFRQLVDQLIDQDYSIVILWPTGFKHRCHKAREVKQFLDQSILETRPWIERLKRGF